MIDQLARIGAESLDATTTINVEAGLAEIRVRRVRQQRRTRVALVAAAVLAVGLGGVSEAVLTRGHDSKVPPSHPAPSRTHTQAYCPTVVKVRCLGHDVYRFGQLVRPVDWKIPSDFGVGSGLTTRLDVESWRNTGSAQAGVTVLERAHASSLNGRGPAAGVADGPRALIEWVASRPFLHAGPVRTTTLDGHRAWRVRVTLAPHLPPGPATTCTFPRCYPVVHQPDGSTSGTFRGMTSDYLAIRLPGAGTTVVWSWSFAAKPRLDINERVVRGLSWRAH